MRKAKKGKWVKAKISSAYAMKDIEIWLQCSCNKHIYFKAYEPYYTCPLCGKRYRARVYTKLDEWEPEGEEDHG